MLRTEPPGATCSVLRNGVVVASVAVTPDFAMVPRRNEPIEVVCRKGNLEQSMSFAPVRVSEGETKGPSARECEQRERSVGELAAGFGASAVEVLLFSFPPTAIAMAAVGVAAVATA